MNNIALGKFVNINSYLHRINPIVKMVSVILFIIALFIIPLKDSLLYIDILLGFSLFLILIISFARLNIIDIIKGIKPLFYLLFITLLMQIFFNKTGEVYFNFHFNISYLTIFLSIFIFLFYIFSKRFIKFKFTYFLLFTVSIFLIYHFIKYKNFNFYTVPLTKNAIYRSIFLFIRVLNVILITSILTCTTNTTNINYGLTGLLYPLKFIKVPVETFSMMVGLTFRFIPTLYDESVKILKAQASRGVDFNEGGFFKKIKQAVSFLVPLFVLSFKRAEDMANAMEIRGYEVGMKRTSIDKYRFTLLDFFTLLLSFIVLAGAILVLVLTKMGYLKWDIRLLYHTMEEIFQALKFSQI